MIEVLAVVGVLVVAGFAVDEVRRYRRRQRDRFALPVEPVGVRVRLVNGDLVEPVLVQYTGEAQGIHHWACMLPAPVVTREFAATERRDVYDGITEIAVRRADKEA